MARKLQLLYEEKKVSLLEKSYLENTGARRLNRSELASLLGTTEANVSVMTHRLKQKFGEHRFDVRVRLGIRFLEKK